MKRLFAVLLSIALAAPAFAQHTVAATWQLSSTPGIASQQVYRGSQSGGPYTDIVPTLGSAIATYVDAMVSAGQTYYYVLTATDASGNVSGFSNEAVAVIPGAPPPPPSASSVFLRYGTTANYTDPSGNVWKGSGCPVSTASVSHAISNTTTQPLYQIECYGTAWSLKIMGLTAGAQYTLTGKFAETYWSAAGKRVFSVTANGAAWLTAFDIFKDAGGEFIADDKTTTVTADSTGTVTLAFTTAADNAKIDALSLIPSGRAPPPPTPSFGITCVYPTCTLSETNVPAGNATVTITNGSASASTTVAVP